eukprot:scaffold33776_cov222-Skeletonema_dohrnii-CCMP3373.AAC.1
MYCKRASRKARESCDDGYSTTAVWMRMVEVKRVSRQAKELLLLMTTVVVAAVVVMMILVVVEEVNTLIYCSFVEIRTFDSGFGLQSRIVDPSRVEMIGKRSISCLETTTNR